MSSCKTLAALGASLFLAMAPPSFAGIVTNTFSFDTNTDLVGSNGGTLQRFSGSVTVTYDNSVNAINLTPGVVSIANFNQPVTFSYFAPDPAGDPQATFCLGGFGNACTYDADGDFLVRYYGTATSFGIFDFRMSVGSDDYVLRAPDLTALAPVTTGQVPEPASLALVMLALTGLSASSRLGKGRSRQAAPAAG